jgi:GT2 family glycosyltransferase/spore maturation protein CgeB
MRRCCPQEQCREILPTGSHPPGDSGTDAAHHPDPEGISATEQELEALRRSLASTGADLQRIQRQLAARQRELDQLRGTATAALAAIRDQLERVGRSGAWRLGHGAARAAARARGRRPTTAGGVAAAIGQVDRLLELLGAARTPAEPASTRPARGDGPTRLATRGDQILLGRRVRDVLGPAPTLASTPTVAVIIVSRSRHRLLAVLERLAEAKYESISVVVIDNASPDSEVTAAARAREGVIHHRFDPGVSFAQANNHGAELTEAELLLFLNDDVQPIEPGWLDELVDAALARDGESDRKIVGATLVDPSLPADGGSGASGWQLEQRGVGVGIDEGGPHPVRREGGADLFGPGFGIEVPAVAVSGACFLIWSETFSSLGGFDTGYQFGLEDVDLCLRARACGHQVVCSGRAVVVHEGSGTQLEAGREFRRVNRAINRRRFRQLWASQIRRERLDGLLDGDPTWGSALHLGVVRTSNDASTGWGDYYTALELGEAAQSLGWRVTYLAADESETQVIPADLDLAVVLLDRWDLSALPAATIRCAWIRNWTERWLTRPWFERYDMLLASSARSAELISEVTGRPVELFPLATNPRRFRPPAPDTERTLDWAFTGNRWGEPRAIEPALSARRGSRGAVFGRGWDQVKQVRPDARGALRYDELPAVYASAKIMLDDTAEPTLAYDAVNARVFDALASGALVLTNCQRGVQQLFDEQFPTWSDAAQAKTNLDRLLAEPAKIAELAGRYRQTVLDQHTYQHRLRRLRQIARAQNDRLSFCLKIGAPDWEQAERWGDLHFASAFGRALRRLGHRWQVDILPEWDSAASSTFDVAIHLHGRSRYAPVPGQFNVLWLISHPESFDEAQARGYDLICVASAPFAETLRARVHVPVHVLEQATDPRLFYPDHDPALTHELVFVGNSRGTTRKIFEDLLPSDRDLAVWGTGWEGTDVERFVVAEHMPNRELRKVYSSAAIVLCDHWPDMRANGFRSNRLYDALACGALVLSDRVAGLDGSLGDAVITYKERGELAELIGRLLEQPDERARRTTGARDRILAGETFDDRARELIAWVSAAA